MVRPEVNGVPLEMEIDTGASLSIMSEQTKQQKFPNLEVKLSLVVLKTYTGEQLTVLGQMEVDLYYKVRKHDYRYMWWMVQALYYWVGTG